MFSVVPLVIYSHRQSWGGTRILSVASFASASLLPLQFLCCLPPSPTLGINQLCVAYTPELYYRKREMGKTTNERELGTLKWFSISLCIAICAFTIEDTLPQVSVQIFQHSVLVLNCLEYGLHHVWAVTVAMWRVRTCTNKIPIHSIVLELNQWDPWDMFVHCSSLCTSYFLHCWIAFVATNIFRFLTVTGNRQKTGAPITHFHYFTCDDLY